MTEPKRATWREFVEWVAAERAAYCPGPVYGLENAAGHVRSRREARAALLGMGMRTESADRLCDEWISLRGEHPAGPPSVAEVPMRLSYQFDACENDAASASSSLAWKTAAKMARTKAQEFT